MKRIAIFIIICCASMQADFAAAQTRFERIYGGSGVDIGYAVTLAPDGNYIVAGLTNSFGGDAQMYAIKLNQDGDIVWQNHYGGQSEECANSICVTPDHCFVLAGYSTSFGNGHYDLYLHKIDSAGNSLDYAFFGGDSTDQANSVCATYDGGLVVAGNTSSFGATGSDGYIIKVNGQLDSVWAFTYHYPAQLYNDYISSIVETSDSGFITVGQYGAWPPKAWVMKVSRQGNSIWQNIYSSDNWGRGSDILEKSPGQYYATGVWAILYQTSYMTLIKINSGGSMAGHWNYGAEALQMGESIISTSDGGFAIAGSVMRGGNYDVMLVKTDSLGTQSWCRYFGGADLDMAYGLIQTTDNGYLIVGYTRSFGASNNDVYVIKTDSSGLTSSIEDNRTDLPAKIGMASNYPNPFNNQTIIEFNLAEPGPVTIEIYDVLGRLVSKHTEIFERPGIQKLLFDGTGLASGMYLYSIRTASSVWTKTMLLLK